MRNLLCLIAVLIIIQTASEVGFAQKPTPTRPNVTGEITALTPAHDPNFENPLPAWDDQIICLANATNNERRLIVVGLTVKLYQFDPNVPVGGNAWGDPIATTPNTQYSTIIVHPGRSVDLSASMEVPDLGNGTFKVEATLSAGFIAQDGTITQARQIDFKSHTFHIAGN